MRPILVDSDILIDVTRARDAQLLDRWQVLIAMDRAVLCSAVSVAEVWRGALPRETEATEALFDGLVCVAVTSGVGRKAAEYLRKFGASHGVQLGDALIGASAHLEKAMLWTRNRKHYPMRDVEFF